MLAFIRLLTELHSEFRCITEILCIEIRCAVYRISVHNADLIHRNSVHILRINNSLRKKSKKASSGATVPVALYTLQNPE